MCGQTANFSNGLSCCMYSQGCAFRSNECLHALGYIHIWHLFSSIYLSTSLYEWLGVATQLDTNTAHSEMWMPTAVPRPELFGAPAACWACAVACRGTLCLCWSAAGHLTKPEWSLSPVRFEWCTVVTILRERLTWQVTNEWAVLTFGVPCLFCEIIFWCGYLKCNYWFGILAREIRNHNMFLVVRNNLLTCSNEHESSQ